MKMNFRVINIALVLALLLTVFAAPNQSPVLARANQAENEIASLQASCLDGGRGIMARADSFTGYSQFVRTEAGKPIRTSAALKAKSPADAAYAFLTECGGLFGLQGGDNDLSLMRARSTGDGQRTTVRFQQEYKGIPVVAGEIFVQFDANMNILAMGGEILPRIYLDTTPTTEAAVAQANALAFVARSYELDSSELAVTEPVLKVYDSALLEPWDGPTLLVWEMEVSRVGFSHLRQYVLVNAQRGNVIVSFNQVDAALDLATYDNDGSGALPPAPGDLVCDETDPECDDQSTDDDAKAAHIAAKNTYDFYFEQHGRDSIDNNGMQLISVVNWDNGAACPNAFWNGSQMVYCDGLAIADDVVAHELTHGVTEYESNLFYYFQSGAINESFSDIWGEFVDLTSTTGFDDDDPSVRWEMGENLNSPPLVGALRNMADPTLFNDPDKMSSANYYIGADDNGGVHWNSGIGNKAAYLMTDGDTFNGYTVTGLGIFKTAAIFYEVQTNFLTSGSDYRDLHDALLQACENLVGTTPPNTTEITAGDCAEVLDAVSAVEMDEEPYYGYNPEAPVCDLGGPLDLFYDDIEYATYNWNYNGVINTPNVTDYPHWYEAWWYATTGDWSIYGDDYDYDGGDATSDTFAVMRSRVHLPAALPNAYLRFNHAFGFDDDNGTYYDGGVLEYSLNNGSTWQDAGALIDDPVYGYNGVLDNSPLVGRAAFIGDSHGYMSTRLDLSSLLGQSVLFRWRMGTDSVIYDWGWWVDDVQVYSCMDPVPVVAIKAFKSEKARDGWVLETKETGNKGGTTNATGKLQIGDDASKRQYRSIVSFNTSSLPDNAVIISASLRIKQYNIAGKNPFNTLGSLVADVRKAKFGTSNSLQISDFQASANVMNTGPFNPVAFNKWRIAEVDSAIPFIHKAGVTQFRLRFTKDDNNNKVADFIRFYSGETSASAPQLIIEYFVP